MKPRAARNIALLLVLALLVLLLLYALLLEPLNLTVVDVLIHIVAAGLFVAYNVILTKYYHCTNCGHRLTIGGKVSLSSTCPYCKAEIE